MDEVLGTYKITKAHQIMESGQAGGKLVVKGA